jgi:hypothetical protein
LNTPHYFILGILFIVGGAYTILADYPRKFFSRGIDFEELFGKKVGRVIITVIGTVTLIFGFWLVLKGMFDPYSKSLWINFSYWFT